MLITSNIASKPFELAFLLPNSFYDFYFFHLLHEGRLVVFFPMSLYVNFHIKILIMVDVYLVGYTQEEEWVQREVNDNFNALLIA